MKEINLCRNCGKEIPRNELKDFCSKYCAGTFAKRMKILDEGKETKPVRDIRKVKGIELYKIRGPIKSYKFDYLFDRLTSIFSSKKKFSPIKNPKKILFLRNDHIGDMVYATPAFKIAKDAFLNSKVVVLAEPHNKSVIEKDKNVDEIWEIDLFWRRLFRLKLKALFDYLKILRKIRKENFDVGIDLRRSKLNMFFFLFIPRIKNRVSNYNINGGKVFLTHPLIYKKTNFNHEENVDMMNDAFGLHYKYILPYIAITKDDEKEADSFLKKNGVKKFIVVMPGCTEKEKQWPIDKTDKFIKLFLKKHPNHKIIISSGKGDREIIEQLVKNDPLRCVPEIGVLNFRGLGALLNKADAITANNGAGTDIGWVVDGNLVALAGGTVRLAMHMPLKRTKVIRPPLPRFPYIPAINKISVDDVMGAVDEFMAETRSERKGG